MVDFREMKVGDVLDIIAHEGNEIFTGWGVVTEIYNDHVIVIDAEAIHQGANGMTRYWLDDDTAGIFYKSESEANQK